MEPTVTKRLDFSNEMKFTGKNTAELSDGTVLKKK